MRNITPLSPTAHRRASLIAREERFVGLLVQGFNAVQAYEEAYEPLGRHARAIRIAAYALRREPRIEGRYNDLLREAAGPIDDKRDAVLERLWLMATADRNELVSHRRGACRYCHGVGHSYHWTPGEYVAACDAAQAAKRELPRCDGGLDYDYTAPPHLECPDCAGQGVGYAHVGDTENLSPGGRAIYGGVKQTKDGVQVLTVDPLRAIELFARVAGVLTDKADVRVSGAVNAVFAVARMDPSDPQAMARAYEEMIKGHLTGPSTGS